MFWLLISGRGAEYRFCVLFRPAYPTTLRGGGDLGRLVAHSVARDHAFSVLYISPLPIPPSRHKTGGGLGKLLSALWHRTAGFPALHRNAVAPPPPPPSHRTVFFFSVLAFFSGPSRLGIQSLAFLV